MKNTPAFIVYGGALDEIGMSEEDRDVAASVITRLSYHGSSDVAEALSDGSFEETLVLIECGFSMVMASKTYSAANILTPLDSFHSIDHDNLSVPGLEAVETNANIIGGSGGHMAERCHRCGALCQGEVTTEGCSMCDDEVGDVYNECDCEISGGFEAIDFCELHRHHHQVGEAMPKAMSWAGSYELEQPPEARMNDKALMKAMKDAVADQMAAEEEKKLAWKWLK